MINIQKMIEEAIDNGYQGDKASAKVCSVAVLVVNCFMARLIWN